MIYSNTLSISVLLLFLIYNAASTAAMTDVEIGKAHAVNSDNSYVKPLDRKVKTQLFWGDTHLHSNLSVDAYNYGNTRLGPEEAYLFAKGQAVTANNSMTAQLSRPLDFLVIADHASNMGTMQAVADYSPSISGSAVGKELQQRYNEMLAMLKTDKLQAVKLSDQLSRSGFMKGNVLDAENRMSVWRRTIELADRHNSPGVFTAFIGYEWTQLFYNLHRVVIFKDGAEKVGQVIPFSQYDSNNPEDLWRYLQSYENKTAGEVLAIPHNGNMSQGVMFSLESSSGDPVSPSYAETRSRWEPLFEVTQIKGDSESHPALSPFDEFANFEVAEVSYEELSNKIKQELGLHDYDSWAKKRKNSRDALWDYRYGYARPALKQGLNQQAELGVNPFKFGMIGSTDSHTSLATADDNNFWGKTSRLEPYPNRILNSWAGEGNKSTDSGYFDQAWRISASGYAGIWAEENTRESLFAAMKRKEVYASTGPRINVRFFAGWDYIEQDAFRPNFAQIGYKKGVPMGGDLTKAPNGKSPTFLIRAVKDPEGANLDRIQVIKGWRDAEGELHEKIYNVALSDKRDDQGTKTEAVGNTVDLANATYSNTIGDAALSVVWKDPDFNADELAFYYLRVLEIPTPRWTAYDASYFKLKNIPEDIPMITQERAYTSPIWYTP